MWSASQDLLLRVIQRRRTRGSPDLVRRLLLPSPRTARLPRVRCLPQARTLRSQVGLPKRSRESRVLALSLLPRRRVSEC